jgi:hypothetical protein
MHIVFASLNDVLARRIAQDGFALLAVNADTPRRDRAKNPACRRRSSRPCGCRLVNPADRYPLRVFGSAARSPDKQR